MDVPNLVRQAVGDEELRAGVNLGDEDAVVFTPTRTLVYRGEGLLSDEAVSEYGFDFDRLAVSEGRRKTKFTMAYVDGEQSFTVPGKRTDDVLEQLIEGMLRLAGAIDGGESVTGVFRFSEMTLVITERRLLKHIGEYTWDADFEAFPYDDLTKLAFEEGSVATQVVLGVGSRSERIKAPNAEAGLVRKCLQEAAFAHYGVSSLEALNREIAVEPEDADATRDVTGGLGLDSGIDPLVSDEPADSEGDTPAEQDRSTSQSASRSDPQRGDATANAASGQSSEQASADRQSRKRSATETARSTGSGDETGRSGSTTDAAGDGSADAAPSNAEIAAQLADLTTAVERQNELLDRQRQTVETLIEELRQGR